MGYTCGYFNHLFDETMWWCIHLIFPILPFLFQPPLHPLTSSQLISLNSVRLKIRASLSPSSFSHPTALYSEGSNVKGYWLLTPLCHGKAGILQIPKVSTQMSWTNFFQSPWPAHSQAISGYQFRPRCPRRHGSPGMLLVPGRV